MWLSLITLRWQSLGQAAGGPVTLRIGEQDTCKVTGVRGWLKSPQANKGLRTNFPLPGSGFTMETVEVGQALAGGRTWMTLSPRRTRTITDQGPRCSRPRPCESGLMRPGPG